MKYLLMLGLTLMTSTVLADLKQGDILPAFDAVDDTGKEWSVLEQKGWLVVYFYPAAMTGGCTKQACAYRDGISELNKKGIAVIGVSGDKVDNLAAFKAVYNLNFPLISDFNGEIAKLFGVPTKQGGVIQRDIQGKMMDLMRGTTASRWTYVIDPDKKVAKVFDKVNPEKDIEEVLKVINARLNSSK